jgi:tRNA(fMet)-specific endonuclease VapC
MKKILVDTSIIIDFLRRKDKENSLFFQVFKQKTHLALICFTSITELWAGKSMAKAKNLKQVEEIIKRCQIIKPTLKTAKLAGQLLRQTNYQLSFQDANLAALAIENSLTLITLNQKDFEKIKGIKLF